MRANGWGGSRWRSRVSAVLVTVLAAGLVPALPAEATPAWRKKRPATQKMKSVPGKGVPVRGLPVDAAARAARVPFPKAAWPKAGAAVADLGGGAKRSASGSSSLARGGSAARAVRAGSLPVWVAPGAAAGKAKSSAAAAAGGVGRVRVELLDRVAAERAGVSGVVLRVTPQAATAGGRATPQAAPSTAAVGPVQVAVDYSSFSHAFGGDYGSRLRLVAVPECALTTPAVRDCRVKVPVRFANDVRGRRLSGQVELGGARAQALGSRSGAMLLAVTAGAAGQSGDYSATTLSPSASWQVAAQSGSFSWKYPLRVPPAVGGPSPELSLGYNSGSVDGRVASTNNQPSWVGEGFEMAPGFIERKYQSCTEDGHDDKDDGKEDGKGAKADLCWATDNATMSFGGRAGELVRKSGNEWRLKTDDGTRIEHRFDGFNWDDNKEYWVVTTTDGTSYYFGKGKRSDKDTANTYSAWEVPVFGDDAGEPCHKAAFKDSFCPQVWRWNLDYVVDAHGNSMTYYYNVEHNNYGRNENTAVSKYVRGGWLGRVEYGERAGNEHDRIAGAQVRFDVAERCRKSGAVDCTPDDLKNTTKGNWPDVPFDQICTSTKDCDIVRGPSFFTRKMLTTVTTETYDTTAKKYLPVDSWKLDHDFPDAGDTSRALWLTGITHTGHVGGTIALPKVTFYGRALANRVWQTGDDKSQLNKWRIRGIQSESGAMLSVNYRERDPDCTTANVKTANAARNTRLCYPAWWSSGGDPVKDWFHKYVVDSVLEDGRTGGGVPVETYYEYLGAPAWHWDDGELVKKKHRTWGQFRGFGRVQVRKGDPKAGPQQVTEFTYLRGMHNDRLNADGSERRDISVDPLQDGPAGGIVDHDRLQGYQVEQITYNGSTEISGSVTVPWMSGVTAEDSNDKAYLVGTASTTNRTVLFDQDGKKTGVRRAKVTNTFDSYGMLDRSHDQGDLGKTGDETCTDYTYGRNTNKWLLTLVTRVETIDKGCGADGVQRPADVISDVKTTYNAAGDATKTEKLKGYNGTEPDYVATATLRYDFYGRVTSSTDALNNTTTTSYTPATGGPVTGMSVTNPLGHKVTSTVSPAWGLVTGTTDANGKKTTLTYDALGRRTKVWLPGRATTVTPNLEYAYLIRNNAPTVVTTKTLMHNGGTTVSHELMDGMLRKRQTQAESVGGGRNVSATVYDSRGLAIKSNGPWWNKEEPTTELLDASEGDLPSQTITEFDGVGRPTAEIFRVEGVERWRTTTWFGGDRVSVDPPKGATATTTVTNAQGQTTELWQHHGAAPSGDKDVTRYTYNKGGQLASVVDPAGNTWRYEYDGLGRLGVTDDPDKGVTITHYDDLDRVTSITDDEGRKLYYSYDKLSRKTELRKDALDGDLLASWAYDKLPGGTVVNGQAVSSTRYVGGAVGAKYVQSVTGYDDGYRPTGASITVPSVPGEEALAKTYTVAATYRANGVIDSTTMPAAGGLPEEKLKPTYEPNGLHVGLGSNLGSYVMDAKYTKFAEPAQYSLGLSSGDKWLSLTYGYELGTRRLNEARIDREGTGGSNPDSLVRYTYDDTGNPLRIADTPQGKPSSQHDVQCFEYDHLRRLTEAWAQQEGQCAGQPSAAVVGGVAPYWESFSYDKVGNRTGQVVHDTAGDITRRYAYPDPGQPQPHTLKSVTEEGPGGTKLSQYGYDKTGNTTGRNLAGTAQTLAWDAENHLAKVTQTGKDDTEFLYDANGNRLLRREAGTTTLYLGGTELRLNKATGQVTGTRYYTFNGQTIAVRDHTGKVTFLAGDHHGTNDIAIDAKTMAVTQRRFLPFGNPRGTAPGAWPTDKGFVGGTTDTSTGLTHLGAREYDPATGRFISVDPIVDHGDPQQMHGYSYSFNNPLAFTDPTGLLGWSDWGHMSLDAIGLVPFVGEVADVANGVWYTAEGNYVDAGLSFSSAIPVVGYGASAIKGARTAKRVADAVDSAGDAANAAGNVADAGRAADNLTPPAAPKQPKPPTNPPPAKPKDQPKSQGKGDDGAPSGGGKDAGPGGGKSGGGKGDGGPPKNRGESGSGGGKCSFVPGTQVTLADGSAKPIEQVKIGDQVLAEDPTSGKKGDREVVATFIRDGQKHMVQVTVTDPEGKARNLTVTDNHPFWAAETTPASKTPGGSWQPAGALKAGAWLKTSKGTWVQITAIKKWTAHQQVHNLTVDDLHTYYVEAGDTPVLVHNCGEDHIVLGSRHHGLEELTEKLGGRHLLDPVKDADWRGQVQTAAELLGKNLDDGVAKVSFQLDGVGDAGMTPLARLQYALLQDMKGVAAPTEWELATLKYAGALHKVDFYEGFTKIANPFS